MTSPVRQARLTNLLESHPKVAIYQNYTLLRAICNFGWLFLLRLEVNYQRRARRHAPSRVDETFDRYTSVDRLRRAS